MEKKWFAVRTFNGYEQKVINSLLKQIEIEHMTAAIGKTYLPVMQKFAFTRGKLKLKEELLFPGYIFVEMETTNEAIFFVRGIQYVTGYAGISSMREIPNPMEDGEIDHIIDEASVIKVDINTGDSIKVINHDLYDGQVLKVESIYPKDQKIKVRVDAILGDDFQMEVLDFAQVSKC